ncbi:MAG: polysaccharide biosynthesis tyrosine autokinase [Bryobacteraceae bacterium]|jgi:capsular exopolysaccharide synthesis family protein
MSDQKENLALPAPRPAGIVPAAPERITVYPPAPSVEAETEEAAVPLSHYLWVLKRHSWRILGFVLTAVIATVIVSSRLTPIYESTATIDIDQEEPAGVVGDAAAARPEYFPDQFLATQIRLVQSDSVLRPVVQQFKLHGAKTASDNGPLPGSQAADAPVSLGGLRVTRPANTYLLLISYRSPNPRLAADVANAVANSYILHTYDMRFHATADSSKYMEKQLEDLKAKMERSSDALNKFEKDMGVIDPDQKTSTLTARLVALNTELTNAQADTIRKEAAYNSVKGGSLDAAQASPQGEQLRSAADRLDKAREQFALVKTKYLPNHPAYIQAANELAVQEGQFAAQRASVIQRASADFLEAVDRETMLRNETAKTKEEADQVNANSFDYKRVKNEADTDRSVYTELVRKIQEDSINSSFQNSSIRLADAARPALGPVYPDTTMNAALALLFSTLTAFGVALLSDTLDNTVRDPEQIQRGMKVEVLGSLPVVKGWRGRIAAPARRGRGRALSKAGYYAGGQATAFEEAVRTLRDSILLADATQRPRSLLITSAVPREGKTTVSLHLAIAHSTQRRKTLLIDADLRRPGIHGRIGLTNERGFSTVVNDDTAWRDLLQQPADFPYLNVLVAGPASRRAADRAGGALDKLLEEAKQEYDLVIIDSPPLLGFAEPLQMAALVDGVVVITLAGQTSRDALASVINNLRRLRARVIGVALNEVRQDMSDRYYYYGYYGKYYSRYYKPTSN